MSKFNTKPDPFGRAGRGASPMVAERTPSTVTHEGAPAFQQDDRTAVFFATTSGFVAEDKYYETGNDTVERVRAKVRNIAVEAGPRKPLAGAHTGKAVNPLTGRVHDDTADTGMDWLLPFTSWLRRKGNMRTAPIVVAAEAVHARLAAGIHGGNRALITAALLRADEPGELVAYWHNRFGRALPKAVKRGIADALPMLYTQYSALKYDTSRHNVRFGDVVDLVHPDDGRHAFYRWLIDRRHDRANAGDVAGDALPMVQARALLEAVPVHLRRNAVGTDDLAAAMREAGATWEWLSGWLADGKGMDAAAWEAAIPGMGYMARLRNLRNFDQANVNPAILDAVAQYLMDPAQVLKSKQFPFRFLSALRAAPSVRWAHPLNEALTLSTQNIPVLDGHTLVIVDTSASMNRAMSGKSQVSMVDAAALFGVAVCHANRNGGGPVDIHGFADNTFQHVPVVGGSLITEVERFRARVGEVGHGTEAVRAIRQTLKPHHTRVLMFSDMQIMQDRDGWGSRSVTLSDVVPANIPLYTWDLSGYGRTPMPGETPNRYPLGGLTDATFRLPPLIELGQRADWNTLFRGSDTVPSEG